MNEELNLLKEQLVALEMKVAYQEDTIEQLNASLFSHQTDIQALQAKMDVMSELLKTLRQRSEASGSDIYPFNEIPPHY